MIRTVLAAVDGSDPASRAAELAADITARFGAELVLCHVMVFRPIPEPLRRMAEIEHLVEPATRRVVPTTYVELPADATEDMRIIAALAEKFLDDAEALARERGVERVRKVPLEGEPADRILEQAERVGADLIACGSRGMGELTALLLGSVSHKLLQLAPCPVLVAK